MLICFHINASVTEESNKSAFLLIVCFYLFIYFIFNYLLASGPKWHFLQTHNTPAANTPTHFLGPPPFVTDGTS